uniref:Uncharacterized protein n=1 Tax=Alexandrium catenella TaxID=2925 RepID=A0A7S1Q8V5_ALECA|mmetsp:Transcript_22730/g.62033  ORF Transcript_22730/g.62033 Transcript_22730/m.62033 type:complete len:301 (+) Transcript_22730:83-985(+)
MPLASRGAPAGTCPRRRALPAVGLLAAAVLGGLPASFSVPPALRLGSSSSAPRVPLAPRTHGHAAGAAIQRASCIEGVARLVLITISSCSLALALMRPGSRAAAQGTAWASPVARQATAEAAEGTAAAPEEEDEDALPPPPPPFDPAAQVGAVAPLGFFDPLGFCPPGDEGKFRGLRAAELKHGRVAMMAAIGAVAQHYIRFPFLGLPGAPSGLKATSVIPSSYAWTILVFVCAIVELLVWTQDPRREVGDFGNPLGVKMYDEDMRNRELNNGRFAMFAAIGIIAGELATGKDAVQQLGL